MKDKMLENSLVVVFASMGVVNLQGRRQPKMTEGSIVMICDFLIT